MMNSCADSLWRMHSLHYGVCKTPYLHVGALHTRDCPSRRARGKQGSLRTPPQTRTHVVSIVYRYDDGSRCQHFAAAP